MLVYIERILLNEMEAVVKPEFPPKPKRLVVKWLNKPGGMSELAPKKRRKTEAHNKTQKEVKYEQVEVNKSTDIDREESLAEIYARAGGDTCTSKVFSQNDAEDAESKSEKQMDSDYKRQMDGAADAQSGTSSKDLKTSAGHTPQVSKRLNFVEKLQQAREQHNMCGRPPRPTKGKAKSDKWLEYEQLLRGTFGRTAVFEIHSLLLSPQRVFDKWIRALHLWLNGDLPNSKGEVTGKKQDARDINMSLFRPTQTMEIEDLELLVEMVLNKEVLLIKSSFCKSPSPDLKTQAKKLKDMRVLKLGIENFFFTMTGRRMSMSEIVSECRLKETDIEQIMEWSQSWISDYQNPKKPKRPMPSLVTSRLAHVWERTHGSVVEEEKDGLSSDDDGGGTPCSVYTVGSFLEDLSLVVEKEKRQHHEIVLTVVGCINEAFWNKRVFQRLLELVHDINSLPEYNVVFFVKSGPSMMECHSALRSMQQHASVKIFFGYYACPQLEETLEVESLSVIVILAVVSRDSSNKASTVDASNTRRPKIVFPCDDDDDSPNERTQHVVSGNDLSIRQSCISSLLDDFSRRGRTVMEVFCGGSLVCGALERSQSSICLAPSKQHKELVEKVAMQMASKKSQSRKLNKYSESEEEGQEFGHHELENCSLEKSEPDSHTEETLSDEETESDDLSEKTHSDKCCSEDTSPINQLILKNFRR